mgnify:CR=1 FL=1
MISARLSLVKYLIFLIPGEKLARKFDWYGKKRAEAFNVLKTTTPPVINNHLLPFKMVFSKKTRQLEFALNHFYCDGKILHDFIIHVVLNCNDNSLDPSSISFSEKQPGRVKKLSLIF